MDTPNECCRRALQKGHKRCGICKLWLASHSVGESNPLFGKHHTDATKELMRESQLGKHHTDITKARIGEAAVKDGRCRDYPEKLYQCWYHMIDRCEDEHCPSYPDYGGRGIQVCEEWHDPIVFFAYVMTLDHYGEPGRSIDRYPNNDGGYVPDNVRWATPSMQTSNRRRSRRT